ncbi:MAG: primosomal protein N' [Hydrogenophaga sp.]|nr:primosomal protein N' [Hydrogenophaga sp.]
MSHLLPVVVATPAHSGLGPSLTYEHAERLPPGTLVRVPLGKREVLGVVWDGAPAPGSADMATRPIAEALNALVPLPAAWRQLVGFAGRYYQRSLGEVSLAALPPQLRELNGVQLARRLKRQPAAATAHQPPPLPELSPEQLEVMARLDTARQPVLLFGSTGSGKTEIYLRAVQQLLDADPLAQALVMVPEINLTPQLETRFGERFGADGVVAMHSGMTPPQRLASWLAAHSGAARIVLGTRMAVFASLPHLRLIVVDEEHDPSYKSQEGARYSARDLAVYLAKQVNDAHPTADGQASHCRVLLGSATPSLESWHAAETGRYQRLAMPSRIGGGSLPRLRMVDMNHQPRKTLLAQPLLDAIIERIARGEQSLLLLNRRGYAPVLACHDCGWKSECAHCSAHRVFHKIDRTLRCHHCGFTERVPRACPACGNLDIAPLGRGTEQIEEHIIERLTGVLRPDGMPAEVARMDADSTRLKGSLEQHLARMHSGEVDVLVGTQMVAKGHDFRRITLVASVNADAALFASDCRAPERLFALLMQAAGRAGRDASLGATSEMWVQTGYPQHPLFAALRQHDYPAFAAQELRDREAAAMPPFAHQALVRADARAQDTAQAFLNEAAALATELPGADQVTVFPAVPMSIQRVANVERAQMLLESPSRVALQRFLAAWQPVLLAVRQGPAGKGLVRWAIDVDPLNL